MVEEAKSEKRAILLCALLQQQQCMHKQQQHISSRHSGSSEDGGRGMRGLHGVCMTYSSLLQSASPTRDTARGCHRCFRCVVIRFIRDRQINFVPFHCRVARTFFPLRMLLLGIVFEEARAPMCGPGLLAAS